ncbi:hydrogenase formation protein HypD [Candidatus Venteria ishoeyi]|uniref:hydrogenase formation protein HypD n=1 Tax=Candidatus Venteria ishoeyi TaxID=1899563 RepID=UPI0025A68C32|nr:hydrogenase formation protein HypD [Candidatus Venteria ishoeyi]MDM8546403.1 hydrogenase formation protein HypD [Candidatus Venteria ishoeyi]
MSNSTLDSNKQAKYWLQRIHELDLQQPVRIMNVCGGHERAITMAGLRSALPKAVELIPGPGCPVCICPEEDIYEAIQISLQENVILVAFGDMLRVPVNVHHGEVRTLDQAKGAGADIRPIASPQEAIDIARQHPQTTVVFFAAGFETTMAPVAAMIAQGAPDNLCLLLSGRLTWPAVAMLLESGSPGFDCLVAPGHVATVMGAEEWTFVVKQYSLPTAVAGFYSESLLAAFYSVLRQKIEQRLFLDNCYPELVQQQGNPSARKQLQQVFNIIDANWRGIGTIPASGYALNDQYAAHDARQRYPDYRDMARKRAGQMPPGCDCAKVVLGKIYPDQCRLYGKACTPRNPVGPCMVSDEGACRIWWAGGVRQSRSKIA